MSRGSFPYRRTFQHLSNVPFRFHPDVRIMMVNYNNHQLNSRGLLKFIYEKVPQLQYGHPWLQVLRQGNEPHKPLPYIQLYFHDGHRVHIDCENKQMNTITQTLEAVGGDLFDDWAKRRVKIKGNLDDHLNMRLYQDKADFKWYRGRKCICEIPGQSPCSRKQCKKNQTIVYNSLLYNLRQSNKAMAESL